MELETATNPGSMYRIITVQADGPKLAVIESMVSGYALEDQQAGILAALKQNMDRQILAAVGHVDPHRFWLYYEYPEGNPYMTAPGIPRHEVKPKPTEGAYILNGPEGGTWTPIFAYKANTVRTINGNNVETYALERLNEMTFAVHRNTEAPQYMAPGKPW